MGPNADAATLFDVSWWAQQAGRLLAWQQQSPALFLAGFMLTFVLLSAFALPGCAPLSLLAGSAFGALAGTLLVGLASTLGALLSFLAARHWARDRVQRRFGHRLHGLDAPLVPPRRAGPVRAAPGSCRALPAAQPSARPEPAVDARFLLAQLRRADDRQRALCVGRPRAGRLQTGSPDWATLAGAATLMLAITLTGRQDAAPRREGRPMTPEHRASAGCSPTTGTASRWSALDRAGRARFDHAGFDLFSLPEQCARWSASTSSALPTRQAARGRRLGWRGVLSHHEQFGALAAALVAERLGLPGTTPESILAAQHKLHARQVLQQVAPEANLALRAARRRATATRSPTAWPTRASSSR